MKLLNPLFFLNWLTLHCCDSGGSAPKNDPRIGQAAMEQVALAREALAWSKERDVANAERQKVMDDLAGQVARQQMETSEFAQKAGQEQYERYKAVAAPVEDKMFDDALNYDSNERQVEAGGRAGAEVQQNLTAAKAASAREMARMGVNPNSARFKAISDATTTTGALAEAAAENDAKMRVRETAVGLRKDAAGIARTMPAASAAMLGASTSAAAGATSATIGAAENSARTTANSMNAYRTALDGVNAGGSLLQQNYDSQVRAYSAKQSANSQMMGSMVGAVAGAASAYGTRRTVNQEKPA